MTGAIRQSTANTFDGGLMMDLNPLSTPNNVLTNCLNGTLLTYNGNENMLQNDMGNGRVKTAFLPEGYIPVGIAELGGIMYIASYNPQTNKGQIGSFPSPERNIMSDEIDQSIHSLNIKELIQQKNEQQIIVSPSYKMLLTRDSLSPGDKFQIFSPDGLKENLEKGLLSGGQYFGQADIDLDPRYLKLHIVAQGEDGKLQVLDNDLTWQPIKIEDKSLPFYIKPQDIDSSSEEVDLDEYRDLVSSNYSVYCGNNKAKLCILAELECIDSFSVVWDAIITDAGNQNKGVKIFLGMNWTSSTKEASRINLNKVLLNSTRTSKSKLTTTSEEIKLKYPELDHNGDTDVLKLGEQVVKNPEKTNELGETVNVIDNEPRKNDGTDNEFFITHPTINFSDVQAETDDIVTLDIIPGMPFGFMEYLKQNITINLGKVGTGETSLVRWQYYVENNRVQLNYGFDMYPEKNKKVDRVRIDFIPLDDEIKQVPKEIDTCQFRRIDGNQFISINSAQKSDNNLQVWYDAIDKKESKKYIELIDKPSYSGNFSETIQIGDDNEQLEPDKCYIAKITIYYNNQERRYYRILYTSEIFNSQYPGTKDFAEIKLYDELEITSTAINKNTWTSTEEVYDEEGNIFDFTKLITEPTMVKGKKQSNIALKNVSTVSLGTKNAGKLFEYFLNDPSASTQFDSTNYFKYLPEITYTDFLEQIEDYTVTGYKNEQSRIVFNNPDYNTFQLITQTGAIIDSPFVASFAKKISAPISYQAVQLTQKKGYQTGDFSQKGAGFGSGAATGHWLPGQDKKEIRYTRNDLSPQFSNSDILVVDWNITFSSSVNQSKYLGGRESGGNIVHTAKGTFSNDRVTVNRAFETVCIRGIEPIVIPTHMEKNSVFDSSESNLEQGLYQLYKYIKSSDIIIAYSPNNITYYDQYKVSFDKKHIKALKLQNLKIGGVAYQSYSPVDLPLNMQAIESSSSLIKVSVDINSSVPYLMSLRGFVSQLLSTDNQYYRQPDGTIVSGIANIAAPINKNGSPRTEYMLHSGTILHLAIRDGYLYVTKFIEKYSEGAIIGCGAEHDSVHSGSIGIPGDQIVYIDKLFT